jgi:pimeloyl-ACP methyl ester carboxylesterase
VLRSSVRLSKAPIPQPLAFLLHGLSIQAATLVIWGEQDPYLLTGNLEGLETFVPRLELRRVPDATHWVIHEKPALVDSYIREFVQNKPPRQQSA